MSDFNISRSLSNVVQTSNLIAPFASSRQTTNAPLVNRSGDLSTIIVDASSQQLLVPLSTLLFSSEGSQISLLTHDLRLGGRSTISITSTPSRSQVEIADYMLPGGELDIIYSTTESEDDQLLRVNVKYVYGSKDSNGDYNRIFEYVIMPKAGSSLTLKWHNHDGFPSERLNIPGTSALLTYSIGWMGNRGFLGILSWFHSEKHFLIQLCVSILLHSGVHTIFMGFIWLIYSSRSILSTSQQSEGHCFKVRFIC